MPNGDAFKFPSFPTQLTEEDSKLLQKLKTDKATFEKIYQQRLTPEAWKELPKWQTAPLSIIQEATTKFPPAVGELLPNVLITPEVAQQRKIELDREIFELERRASVTNRLPLIQAELTYRRLMNETVTDPALLGSLFQDLAKDFTEEERKWVTSFATGISLSTPEEIFTGGGFVGVGKPMELTPKDLEAWYAQYQPKPKFVLTTVALSQDETDITAALQAQYSPQVEDETEEGRLVSLENYYRQLAVEQGILPEEGESVEHLMGRVHKEKADEGKVVYLEDADAGIGAKGRILPDNNVYAENDIGVERIGTYNPETEEIMPLSEEEQVAFTDQVPFTITTEDGEDMELTWKLSDSSIWLGKRQVGSIDEEGNIAPTDPEWWEKALTGVFTGLEVAFAPFKIVGMTYYDWFVGADITEESREKLDTRTKEIMDEFNYPYGAARELALGEVTKKEYQALPWWHQLLFEVPTFVGLGAAGVSATSARVALAPIVARGGIIGVSAQAARVALAPVAGYEWVTGKTLYYVIGLPAKKIISTASNRYFQAMWNKSFPSNIFKRGTPEYDDMFKVWKLYHTKPPAGQPADAYEKAAHQAFEQNMKSNLKFREGILSWMKDVSSKAGTPQEAQTVLTLRAATAATADASPSTQAIIANVVKQTTEANLSTSGITASTISKLVPEGISLEVPVSLVTQLEEMGYSRGIITDMEPEEAWATMLSGKVRPELGETVIPPEVAEQTQSLTNKLENIEAELIIYENSHQMVTTRIQKMEAAKTGALEVKELEEAAFGLKTRIGELNTELDALKPVVAPEVVPVTPEVTAPIYTVQFRGLPEFEGVRGLPRPEGSVSSSNVEEINAAIREILGKAGTPSGAPITGISIYRGNEEISRFDDVDASKPNQYIVKDVEAPPTVTPEVTKVAGEPAIPKARVTPPAVEEIAVEPEVAEEPPLPPTIPPKTAEALQPEPSREPVTDEGLLRVPSFGEVSQTYREVSAQNPALMRMSIKGEKSRKGFLGTAKSLWSELDEEGRTALAKSAGLAKPKQIKSKKSWNELSLEDQEKLAFWIIPNGSLSPKTHWAMPEWGVRVFNIEQELQFYEEAFGGLMRPSLLYGMRSRPITKGIVDVKRDEFALRIGRDPNIALVRESVESQIKVRDAFEAEYAGTTPPELTESEQFLKMVLMERGKFWEPYARVIKFENYYSPNLDKMLKSFPDVKDMGAESELQEAINLYQTYKQSEITLRDIDPDERLQAKGEADEAWLDFVTYMKDREWGLIKNGYSPRLVVQPSLFRNLPSLPLSAQRGRGRFIARKSVKLPERTDTLLKSWYLYEQQMLSNWYMREVWDEFGNILDKVWDKLRNPQLLNTILTKYRDTVEGYPGADDLMLHAMARVRKTAAITVFNTMPYLPFRNLHQGAAFHFERTWYLRAQAGERFPDTDMELLYDVFYGAVMNEMKGIRMDWLWGGEKFLWEMPELAPDVPKTVVKGLKLLAAPWKPLTVAGEFLEELALYPLSDDVIRKASGKGYGLKAWYATQQYLKDGDLKKWLQESGAMNLRRLERGQAISYLLQDKVDLIVPGLRNISGDKAAILYLADHETALTHFLYHRHERAELEMGDVGKLTWELGTFTRQYVQRMAFQLESFDESVRGKNWTQARVNFKNIVAIMFFGRAVSAWLSWATGRRRRAPYSLFDIIDWELGGFALGVTEDLLYGFNQFLIGVNPESSEEDKSRAITNIITKGTRLTDTLFPVFATLMESISAYQDLDPDARVDREWFKDLRAALDESYTKEEQEKAEMTFIEKFQRALFGGRPVEPTELGETRKRLDDFESQLGQLDDRGQFYSNKELGNAIDASRMRPPDYEKGLPDTMFNERHGFSPLQIEYFTYAKEWDKLQKTTSVGSAKNKYRQEVGADFDAWLLFWSKYNKPVQETAEENWQVYETLWTLFELYGVNKTTHSYFRSWENLTREEWQRWVEEQL